MDLPAAQAAALNSLVASVGELEAGQHDADVPQLGARATKGGPARASRAGARGARQVAADDDADELMAAGVLSGAAGGGGGGSDDLDSLTLAQLKERCVEKGVPITGTKPMLKERLRSWQPGMARSKRGRPPGPGKGTAKKAKGAIVDDEEEDEAEAGEELEDEEEGGRRGGTAMGQ